MLKSLQRLLALYFLQLLYIFQSKRTRGKRVRNKRGWGRVKSSTTLGGCPKIREFYSGKLPFHSLPVPEFWAELKAAWVRSNQGGGGGGGGGGRRETASVIGFGSAAVPGNQVCTVAIEGSTFSLHL